MAGSYPGCEKRQLDINTQPVSLLFTRSRIRKETEKDSDDDDDDEDRKKKEKS